MSDELIIWGSRGQAKVLKEIAGFSQLKVIALVDDFLESSSPFQNVPLLYGEAGFEKWHSLRSNPRARVTVAIGGEKGKVRLQKFEFFLKRNLEPINLIHPSAHVAPSVSLSYGIQVMAGATISTDTDLGSAVIVNTGAVVDQSCVLGRGVHIGPGCTLSGEVKVGEFSFIGAGSVILPRVKIGKSVIIGAGSIVTEDIPDNVIALGQPARVTRKR